MYSFIAGVRLEIALLRRDVGALVGAGVLAALLVVSVVLGHQANQSEGRVLRLAAEQAYAEWGAQLPKNPHDAAHFGTLVYRPSAPLQALDPGVLPYQGAVVFLGAHRRESPMLSQASVRNVESRYGGTRFSLLLQLAMGFLAMLLGYLAGAREVRRGITPTLLGAGARGGPLVAAKTVTFFMLIAAAIAPASALACFSVEGNGAVARLGGLLAVSFVHLCLLSGLGVAAGVLVGGARGGIALVVLWWAFGAVVAPRLASAAAEAIYPSTRLELNRLIEADFAKGPDGHSETEANRQFRQKILDQYRVKRPEDLPVNLDALLMQADEEFRATVYTRRLGEAQARQADQDRLRALAWVFSPTPATADLCARLAGTHAGAQRRFDEAAEAFRLRLVGQLNGHMARNSRTGDWTWTPAQRYYASFTAFRPPAPSLAEDLGGTSAVLALVGWFVVTLATLVFAARRLDGAIRQ